MVHRRGSRAEAGQHGCAGWGGRGSRDWLIEQARPSGLAQAVGERAGKPEGDQGLDDADGNRCRRRGPGPSAPWRRSTRAGRPRTGSRPRMSTRPRPPPNRPPWWRSRRPGGIPRTVRKKKETHRAGHAQQGRDDTHGELIYQAALPRGEAGGALRSSAQRGVDGGGAVAGVEEVGAGADVVGVGRGDRALARWPGCGRAGRRTGVRRRRG